MVVFNLFFVSVKFIPEYINATFKIISSNCHDLPGKPYGLYYPGLTKIIIRYYSGTFCDNLFFKIKKCGYRELNPDFELGKLMS